MKALRSTLPVALTALLIASTALAIANQGSVAEPHWILFELLDHGVLFQDISASNVVYRNVGEHMTLLNIGTGETRLLDDFLPCGELPNMARIEDEWLVVQFLCLDVGETRFQSHVYNLETGESLLLAPDPPDPALPYSWYVDIDNGRVVWAKIADCSRGDIYMLDLHTRDISKVTEDPGTGARLNLNLGAEWLAWDEYRLDEDAVNVQVLDVHAANLSSGETITVTLSDDAVGNMPLAGDNIIVWNETNASYLREIWALDLTSTNRYRIEASGDFPFAADLSGDLLVLSDQVGADSGTAPDRTVEQPVGMPDEPCDRTRAKPQAHNRLRLYYLVTDSDAFVYLDVEANSLYNARIDESTAIWVERVNVDSWHVLAARRFDHQFYMPLVFR